MQMRMIKRGVREPFNFTPALLPFPLRRPIDRPFDRLTVLSNVEGLTSWAKSKKNPEIPWLRIWLPAWTGMTKISPRRIQQKFKSPPAPWNRLFGKWLKTYLVSHAGGQAKTNKAHTRTLRYELFQKSNTHQIKTITAKESVCIALQPVSSWPTSLWFRCKASLTTRGTQSLKIFRFLCSGRSYF